MSHEKMLVTYVSTEIAPMTPVVSKELMVLNQPLAEEKKSYAEVVGDKLRVQSPVVTELEHDPSSPPVGSPGYFVQSPEEGGLWMSQKTHVPLNMYRWGKI